MLEFLRIIRIPPQFRVCLARNKNLQVPVAQQTSYGARSCAPSPIAWEHDAVVPGRFLWSDGCVFSDEMGLLERFEESLLIYYVVYSYIYMINIDKSY